MSLQDIRSECTDFATQLQPFVDGELASDDHRRVSDHLEACTACRHAVGEQMWVRSTLRSLPPPVAPSRLRQHVLLALDEVEAEQIRVQAPSRAARFRHAARQFARGSLSMLPAAAVAAGLFAFAKSSFDADTPARAPAVATTPGIGLHTPVVVPETSERVAARRVEMAPDGAAPSRTRARDVQLVSARLEDGDAQERGAHLMFRILRDGRAAGPHVIDKQRPAGGPIPQGTPVTFRGQRYLMGHTAEGHPFLHFERGGIAHWVRLEQVPAPASARNGSMPPPDDLALLLDVADHLSGERE